MENNLVVSYPLSPECLYLNRTINKLLFFEGIYKISKEKKENLEKILKEKRQGYTKKKINKIIVGWKQSVFYY